MVQDHVICCLTIEVCQQIECFQSIFVMIALAVQEHELPTLMDLRPITLMNAIPKLKKE